MHYPQKRIIATKGRLESHFPNWAITGPKCSHIWILIKVGFSKTEVIYVKMILEPFPKPKWCPPKCTRRFLSFPRIPPTSRENWYTAPLENENLPVGITLPIRHGILRILQNAHIRRKYVFFQNSHNFAIVRTFENRIRIISERG